MDVARIHTLAYRLSHGFSTAKSCMMTAWVVKQSSDPVALT